MLTIATEGCIRILTLDCPALRDAPRLTPRAPPCGRSLRRGYLGQDEAQAPRRLRRRPSGGPGG